ncbi:RNA polymerase sigma-70 factor [Pedobacter nyackensis]|uniref:RNA polymerase sigma-70 factor, ECF subfamily n=1 Tax=Pedobacter nyackensis TaxID=475255 RepID=A0A1W2BCS1_9SPHI|nr:RNA polymerase sigma-70 factor [Pedobacter nyackensis]SMC70621.1 RNA polymerase sigma-70 factor, ECF subfamily [Pedobacter nyackensis]
MKEYQLLSEYELLNAIKLNDYLAFEELYRRYFDVLYGYAYNILRDFDMAQDIIQDIFTWFWENREKWELVSCKGYLLTAVKFKTASYFRAAKFHQDFFDRIKEAPQVEHDESLTLEVKQLQELIEHTIKDLPERCRLIFQMSRFSYLSNKEIAAQLDISEKTVEAQITIALKKLRLKLEKYNYLMFFIC